MRYLVEVLITPARASVEVDAETREEACRKAVGLLETGELKLHESTPDEKVGFTARELTDVLDENKLIKDESKDK